MQTSLALGARGPTVSLKSTRLHKLTDISPLHMSFILSIMIHELFPGKDIKKEIYAEWFKKIIQ